MNMKLLPLPEAEKMLPLLRSIVADIRRTWMVILDLRQNVAKHGLSEDQKSEINSYIDKINSYIKEAEALGVFIQEFKRGIVSIPTVYHGRKVFLSVQPETDTSIEYFHELDEAFDDRQPISKNRKYFLLRR